MARKRRLSLWAWGLVVTAVGLMGSSGTQAQTSRTANLSLKPPPLQISGSFDGTVHDSKAGDGTINLTFTEKSGKTKATLKGTWVVNYPETAPEGAINDVGKLKGSIVGDTIKLTLSPRRGDALGSCRLLFTSDTATVGGFSGTYHLTGCGNTGTISVQPGAAPTTVFINIGDDFFFPAKQTISVGQTVEWTNNGSEQHSVNANPGSRKCKPSSGEAFDSGAINTGQTFEHTFNNPGTFAYHCEVHGCPMKGSITAQ